ncbi:hypothetical protein [Streptomyces sp. NPDC088719]|uniref:hypothetical protein n=1 Tax=Streptomyces sp. NPDC088719 TaxID=3365872 RepID=UPI00380E183F
MGYDQLVSAVQIDGGVKRLAMWTIKEYAAPHRERLSNALAQEITSALHDRGIVTLPTILPTDERDWAILIVQKSALGEAVSLATKAVQCSKLDAPILPGAHKTYRLLSRQIK